MCLGLPGKIIEIHEEAEGKIVGKAAFPNRVQTVSLSYLPDIRVGDYVIVHYGFATERIEQQEASDRIKLQQEIDKFLAVGDVE